jgi:hypothetical protein
MNLKNKLNGIPPIYYINLDERTDRKNYTENQYDFWKIKNYKRISASKYKLSNYDEWKNLVILNSNNEIYIKNKRHLIEAAATLSYLDLIKTWIETTNEKYLLILEDDYDLSMIEYWHFDWNFLMNNVPYDWDVIQLSFENRRCMPCFLHPTLDIHGAGAFLINRHYAEKIIRLHYIEEKYNLHQKIGSFTWTKQYKHPSLTGDYIISKNGKSYSIPLMYINPNLGSYEINYQRSHTPFLKHIEKCYKKWWIELRDNYTLNDFFTYGKPNDKIIEFDWTKEP